MCPFYTREGDEGYTGLLGEGRVAKHDPRIEAVGAIDEANAALGVARAAARGELTRELTLRVQRDLYQLMAETAATPENAARFRAIDAARVAWLEQSAATLEARVSIPREFIIPGDTAAGAAYDLARTVVRRAERRLALLVHQGEVENLELLRYLNRLSSLCFVLEIYENAQAGSDTPTLAKTGPA